MLGAGPQSIRAVLMQHNCAEAQQLPNLKHHDLRCLLLLSLLPSPGLVCLEGHAM